MAIQREYSLGIYPGPQLKWIATKGGCKLITMKETMVRNAPSKVLVPKMNFDFRKKMEKFCSDQDFIDFIVGCLQMNPNHRLSCE